MAPASLLNYLFLVSQVILSCSHLSFYSVCISISIIPQIKSTMPATTSFKIKAQEYMNTPLSPRSSEIRLQKRLRNVERSFASMPPIRSSSPSSLSPLNTSTRTLVDKISESSITSPPDSQISVPSPLVPTNHSKNSFEYANHVAIPDKEFLTNADIEKMIDEEAAIYPPYEMFQVSSCQSANTSLSDDDDGVKLVEIVSAWEPNSIKSASSNKLQEDMDVTLNEDEDDVRVTEIVSPWQPNSLKNTAPNKLIAGSYHWRQCKKVFVKSIGLIPISEDKPVDDKTVQPVCVTFSETADLIKEINKKSKGRATYLKVADSIREVNKRSKNSGIQKRRRAVKSKKQPSSQKVKVPSDQKHDCLTRILYSSLMGKQYSVENFDSMYSANWSDIDEAIVEGIIFNPKIRSIWSRGCKHF